MEEGHLLSGGSEAPTAWKEGGSAAPPWVSSPRAPWPLWLTSGEIRATVVGGARHDFVFRSAGSARSAFKQSAHFCDFVPGSDGGRGTT